MITSQSSVLIGIDDMLLRPLLCFSFVVSCSAFHSIGAPSPDRKTQLKAMEIWLDTREASSDSPTGKDFRSQCDVIIGDDGGFTVEHGKLMNDVRLVGKVIDVSTAEGQDEGVAAIGSVEWVLAESAAKEWKMIPAENLIVAAKNGGTRLAFCVDREEDIVGLSRALELGVDALCVKCNVSNEFFDSVLAARAERAAVPAT
jgi:hypothetical protein